jgi:hypothetical protein
MLGSVSHPPSSNQRVASHLGRGDENSLALENNRPVATPLYHRRLCDRGYRIHRAAGFIVRISHAELGTAAVHLLTMATSYAENLLTAE